MKIINSVSEDNIVTMCGSGQFSHQNLKEELTSENKELTCEQKNNNLTNKESA